MVWKRIIKSNWITRKPDKASFFTTAIAVALLLLGSSVYLNDFFGAATWMPASRELIFEKHQYWRLWTTLFAHANVTHIGSNLVLFVPFTYFLAGHFGLFFFPLIGFFFGGIVNYLVLLTMPSSVFLIGVSGVVYFLAATWMILAYLIDHREKKGRRLLRILGVSIILLVPEAYKPDVSYLCHFLGAFFGVMIGALYYNYYKQDFKRAEVVEYVPDIVPDWYLAETTENNVDKSEG